MLATTPIVGPGGGALFFQGAALVVDWAVVADAVPGPFTRDDYFNGLLNLLPPGAAWPREHGGVLHRTLDALGAEMARLDLRMMQLFDEANPGQAAELLGDWERVLGLPDPCVTVVQTIVERREAAFSKMTYPGGQSRAFFIGLAQSMGYSITIDEFRSPAEAATAGVSFTGDGWAHTWRVNVPEAADVRPFRAGSGAAGEPLRTWGNEGLECRFQGLKPAHTICLFAYG